MRVTTHVVKSAQLLDFECEWGHVERMHITLNTVTYWKSWRVSHQLFSLLTQNSFEMFWNLASQLLSYVLEYRYISSAHRVYVRPASCNWRIVPLSDDWYSASVVFRRWASEKDRTRFNITAFCSLCRSWSVWFVLRLPLLQENANSHARSWVINGRNTCLANSLSCGYTSFDSSRVATLSMTSISLTYRPHSNWAK